MDPMRRDLLEVLKEIGLTDQSVFKRMYDIMNKDSGVGDRTNALKAVDIFNKVKGNYAPIEQKIDMKEIKVGVEEPEDIEL